MQKVQVDVTDLQIGMYVADLDRPWRETPFLFQGFEIRTQEKLDALKRYCRTVQVLVREAERSVAAARKPAAPGYLSAEVMSHSPSWTVRSHRQSATPLDSRVSPTRKARVIWPACCRPSVGC